MKIDPFKKGEQYLAWKNKTDKQIKGISKENSDILIRYLNDMEIGINVSRCSKKGARSPNSLLSNKDRLSSLMKKIKEAFGLEDITKLTEEQIHQLFSDMSAGRITKLDGKKYICVRDFVKIFKAFWHWHQRASKKKGIEIQDITLDLDTREAKPDWVYLTEEQVRKLADNARYDYRVLILFLFDTGMRAPTELMNIRVSDFFNDFKELNIREETVKTGSFGRRIKLLICPAIVKDYIKSKNLGVNDYVFEMNPATINKYLKRLARKLFGDGESQAGEKYSRISMYDFRHCSCCYWLPRYKSESALKYRFGWKKSDKIHYYSELLGMKDTIQQEDLLIDVTKTEIEKKLSHAERDNQLLREDNQSMKEQMQKILE